MKDELDMIFSKKEDDIEKISSRYKAVDDKRKEKIYEISRKKYDMLKAEESEASDEGFTISVQGVERYNRPKWYRAFSAVAAAVVLFGGVCGSFMLSRSQKISNMRHGSEVEQNTTYVQGTTNPEDENRNTEVDKLLSNLECILRPLYPGAGGNDIDDLIYFNMDEYSYIAESIVSITKYYYAVTDEKLDTYEEVEAMLNDTFMGNLRSYYLGGDLSNHEVGYDFKDDSMAFKYVKSFITYNGKVYAQSKCEPYSNLSHDFEALYNFSNYKLVSSEFREGGDLNYLDSNVLDENSEPISLDGLMTCDRIYEDEKGVKIAVSVQLLQEDGVWKIIAFDSALNGDDDTQADYKEPEIELPADDGEFAELQLHEMNIYPTEDEALPLIRELNDAWNSGTYAFKKVDTEKYIQQIMNAENYEDLNTLENKSYIYHMLWNSYRYFDTADVTYQSYSEGLGVNDWKKEVHCMTDNRKQYLFFDSFTDYPNDTYSYSLSSYLYDGTAINVDQDNMSYEKYILGSLNYDNEYVPDNYRYIVYYNSDGEVVPSIIYTNNVLGGMCSECLYVYPETFYDFSKWEIKGIEEHLGRPCADIVVHQIGYEDEYYIDLQTGIVMGSYSKWDESGEVNAMEVTSIELDQPLEYVYFDPTGYTEQSFIEY